MKISSSKNYENLSEEAWRADENDDLKNATEQNLMESTQEALEQEVAISTKTVSQSSLFDGQSQSGGLVDQNPQLDGTGDESGQVVANNIFKKNLFDEQESAQNQSELKNDVLNSDDQNQILPKDEQGDQKIPKKPVQQTFDLS